MWRWTLRADRARKATQSRDNHISSCRRIDDDKWRNASSPVSTNSITETTASQGKYHHPLSRISEGLPFSITDRPPSKLSPSHCVHRPRKHQTVFGLLRRKMSGADPIISKVPALQTRSHQWVELSLAGWIDHYRVSRQTLCEMWYRSICLSEDSTVWGRAGPLSTDLQVLHLSKRKPTAQGSTKGNSIRLGIGSFHLL